ncbi:MAG: helix-turn-helix domain-containing protein [Phycisphaerae bacterium]
MAPQSFGTFVRDLRRLKGVTLRAAAAEFGINPSYLSRIENDEVAPPSERHLESMAIFYGVPVSSILERASAKRAFAHARTDQEVATFVSALYRMGQDLTHEERVQMLQAAVEQLNLSPEKKSWWMAELSRLQQGARETGGDDGLNNLHREHRGSNDLFDLQIVPRVLRGATIDTMAVDMLYQFYDGDLSKYVPPTPIEELLEKCEPDVDFKTFGPSVGGTRWDGSPQILGRSRWKSDGRREIAVDSRLFEAPAHSPARRRGNFTLAHEAFHAIEHLPLVANHESALNRAAFYEQNADSISTSARAKGKRLQSSEDWREFQANTFASALLLPRFSLEVEFARRFGADKLRVAPSRLREASLELSRWTSDAFPIALNDLYDVNPVAVAIRLETTKLLEGDELLEESNVLTNGQ